MLHKSTTQHISIHWLFAIRHSFKTTKAQSRRSVTLLLASTTLGQVSLRRDATASHVTFRLRAADHSTNDVAANASPSIDDGGSHDVMEYCIDTMIAMQQTVSMSNGHFIRSALVKLQNFTCFFSIATYK